MFVRIFLSLILVSTVAYAQKSDRTRLEGTALRKRDALISQIESSRWNKGNLYYSPIIGLRNFGYDDNVFSSEQNQIDDISISPQVGMQSFWRPSRNFVWFNKAAYDYLYYQDLSNLRGSEYMAESRMYGLYKRTYIDAGVVYNKDQQRLNSEIDNRVTSDRITFDAHYTYQASARSLISLEGRFNSLTFDDKDLQQGTAEAQQFANLERNDTSFDARYNYQWSSVVWVFGEAGIQDFDFDLEGNPRDNTSFTNLFAGFRTENAKRWTFEGKAGVTSMDFDDIPAIVSGPNGPVTSPTELVDMDEDVFSLEGYFRYRISRQYYMEGSVIRTPLFSLTQDYTYFVSDKEIIEVGFETRRKVRIGPEIMIGSNDYQKSFNRTLPELRKDDLLSYSLNVRFPVRNSFEWRISAGYLERDSNISGASDEGFQLSATMRYLDARR